MWMTAAGTAAWQNSSAERNSGESGSMAAAGVMATTPLREGSGEVRDAVGAHAGRIGQGFGTGRFVPLGLADGLRPD